MGNLLLFAEITEGKVIKASKAALSAAFKLKEKWGLEAVYGVVLGKEAEVAAKELSTYGIDKVFFSSHSELEKYRAVPYESVLREIGNENNCDVYVAAATSTGKDLMPRLAANIAAGQASDIIAVNEDGTLKRPMYAGNVIADVEITTDKKVVTVRGTAFDAAQPSDSQCEVVKFEKEPELLNCGEVLGYEFSKGERPELSSAEVVVSGGRAFGSEENFKKYLYPLADVLGAAIGASRAAVDAGYAPNDWQVGQTGKIVAPNLYIALGISGAIQHIAGMKDSKVIVAVNKDPEAPIFEVADYGLVGDIFEV
ncbi:MAG: electron transfer flavoprotein subunit alpha/FixB family protein, partial [Candidatus Dadabacteria bacterium]